MSETDEAGGDGDMRAAVIVAHPDDETLWAGGTMLARPDWSWSVACLCRADDADRAPRFRRAVEALGAEGTMGTLDDGPEQAPLPIESVRETVLRLLPARDFDALLTHSPAGEYTRHRRHEETGRAVIGLWLDGRLTARELRLFAYSDWGRSHLPQALPNAHLREELPAGLWETKYRIVTEIYGFAPGSFEARTTPRIEACWRFRRPAEVHRWLMAGGARDESPGAV